MHFGAYCKVAVFIVVCTILALQAKEANDLGRRAMSGQEAQKATGQNSYPESAEGLKSFLQDLFAAVRAGNTAKSAALGAEFSIPNHKEWFLRVFGPTEGARIETRYEGLHDQSVEWIKKRIEQNLNDGRTQIDVKPIEKPADTEMPLVRAVLGAMAQPMTIYIVSDSRSPNDKSPYYLGEFVYVEGGFRYLDRQVMHALSTAPPMRVTVGGKVQGDKLIERVPPDYPPLARNAHLQGTVILHVLLGTDGKVQQIQVVSGHPVLTQAAIDAVKKWRYKPTLLNGQPVEVDTEVDVSFWLQP